MIYASPDTIAGQLQYGLGRGARAVRDPSLVDACLTRNYATDDQVDSRDVYLARLVRDLGMPIAGVVARLDAPDSEFTMAVRVLRCLGHAGFSEAVDGVRDYIRRGPGWQEALERVAFDWPVEWWDDLLPAVRDRMPDPYLMGRPWEHWAERDPSIPLYPEKPPHDPRPLAGRPTGDLLTALRKPTRAEYHFGALRELAHRPGEPELLTIVPTLNLSLPWMRGPIDRALAQLGVEAVPTARTWLTGPLHRTAVSVLVAHGDESDVPVLLAEFEAIDHDCGFDTLLTGLARIGYPGVPDLVDRVWLTPHSYERAAYLRASPTPERLLEGLWDCEDGVRSVAVEQVPLTAEATDRLRYLRDDPMEEPDVRSAAAARLAG